MQQKFFEIDSNILLSACAG